MSKYYFSKDKLNLDDFFYAYSPVAKGYAKFFSHKDRISNFKIDDGEHEDIFDYPFITLLTKKKFSGNVKFRTLCSFEKFGAPLLTVVGKTEKNEDGEEIYGVYDEVVAYEKGLNIWHVVPFPEKVERPILAKLLAKEEFCIDDRKIVEIIMEIRDKKIIGTIDGHSVEVEFKNLPDTFHIGITACEGKNSFFEFEIME